MSNIPAKIMVVDDEVNIREALAALLEADGYEVAAAASAEAAMERMGKEPFDIVISDLRLEGRSGLDLLQSLRETSPATEVILLTAYGTVEGAVEAMKLGAYDYISKAHRPAEAEPRHRESSRETAAVPGESQPAPAPQYQGRIFQHHRQQPQDQGNLQGHL